MTDEGPVVDIALDPASDRRFQKPASSLLGPKVIGQLIDRLLAVKRRVVANDGRWTKPESEEHGWLQGLVTGTRVQPFVEAWLSRCNTDDPDAIGSLAELLSRHGTDFSQKEPLFEDVAGQKRLGDALQAHAGALLRSPASKRYQLASLGLAMARVGDRRLTEDLGRLAKEDVKRWRASREDFARNRDRQANSEVSICHTGEFTRAIASLGGDEAREFLESLLDDELASRDAAIALKLLWSQNNVPVEKDAQPKFGPDYSQVAAKRKRRTESPELTCPEARAILDVASKLISSDQGAQQKLAIDLAAIALQMPYGDEDQPVRALLGSSVPILEKFGLIRSLALSGQTVSDELVLGGISGYLDAAETKTWMLDPNSRWSLLQWLDLIPFSDRPAAVLDALKLIPTKYYAPWDLRGLFTAMQNSPDATIEATFFAVAEATPELLTEDWLGALLARKSRATVLSLLDGCLDPKLGPRLLKSFTHFMADRLAEIVAQHPALRAEIAARYQDARYAPAYRLIEDLLARSPDDDTIVLMVRKYAENKRMNDHNLDRAIERVVTENRPVPNWREAYNVHPVAAVDSGRSFLH